MRLAICHLYPDILNLYGDRGNTITLCKRCEWRGIDSKLIALGAGDDTEFDAIDLFFIGGGQDFDQHALMDDFGIGMPGSKATRLAQAIESGVPVLAICGGYQLLGEYYRDAAGQQMDFMGVLPAYTEAGADRLIGNMSFTADAIGGAPVVVGFENHAGRTQLREGGKPFGHIMKGYGNNGVDGTEGCRYKNVFATYSHGPLLPKNPAIADELLRLACVRKDCNFELSCLDDDLEWQAHDAMAAKLA